VHIIKKSAGKLVAIKLQFEIILDSQNKDYDKQMEVEQIFNNNSST